MVSTLNWRGGGGESEAPSPSRLKKPSCERGSPATPRTVKKEEDESETDTDTKAGPPEPEESDEEEEARRLCPHPALTPY